MLCTCQKSMGMVIHRDNRGLFSQITLKDLKIVILIDQSLINQLRNHTSGNNFRYVLNNREKTLSDAVNMTARSLYRMMKVVPDYIVVTGGEVPLSSGQTISGVFHTIFNYMLQVNMAQDVSVDIIKSLFECSGSKGAFSVPGGNFQVNVLGRMFTKTLQYLESKNYLTSQFVFNRQIVSDSESAEALTISESTNTYAASNDNASVNNTRVVPSGGNDSDEYVNVTTENNDDDTCTVTNSSVCGEDSGVKCEREIFDVNARMKDTNDPFVRKYDPVTDSEYFHTEAVAKTVDMVWIPPPPVPHIVQSEMISAPFEPGSILPPNPIPKMDEAIMLTMNSFPPLARSLVQTQASDRNDAPEKKSQTEFNAENKEKNKTPAPRPKKVYQSIIDAVVSVQAAASANKAPVPEENSPSGGMAPLPRIRAKNGEIKSSVCKKKAVKTKNVGTV